MTGRVGVDPGGTFTWSGQTFKVLSTPDDPVPAVGAGVDLGRSPFSLR